MNLKDIICTSRVRLLMVQALAWNLMHAMSSNTLRSRMASPFLNYPNVISRVLTSNISVSLMKLSTSLPLKPAIEVDVVNSEVLQDGEVFIVAIIEAILLTVAVVVVTEAMLVVVIVVMLQHSGVEEEEVEEAIGDVDPMLSEESHDRYRV
jgi:hypothetical protein